MTEFVLGENQSAEPNTCGSCRFFLRKENDLGWTGTCTINLPPWAMTMLTPVEAGNSPERSHADNRYCDLYQKSPYTFVKTIKWKGGERCR